MAVAATPIVAGAVNDAPPDGVVSVTVGGVATGAGAGGETVTVTGDDVVDRPALLVATAVIV